MCDTQTLLVSDGDSTASLITAIGTVAAAVVSAIAVVVALIVAARNRKHQLIDRDEDVKRELQAQADMIVVKFRIFPPQSHMASETPYSGHAIVYNHSGNPILDVTFEIWTQPIQDFSEPMSQTFKIVLPDDQSKVLYHNFQPWKSSQPWCACRLRWRDHYGTQWVLNQGDDYPTTFRDQPPKPAPRPQLSE